jgi:hypothetical protein
MQHLVVSGQCPRCASLLDAFLEWRVCDDCALDVDARLVDWTLFASEPARDANDDDRIVVTRLTYANVEAILLAS